MENTQELFSPDNPKFAFLVEKYHAALRVSDFMGNRMYPLGFDKSKKGYFIKTRSHNLYIGTDEFSEFCARIKIAEGRKALREVRQRRKEATSRNFLTFMVFDLETTGK